MRTIDARGQKPQHQCAKAITRAEGASLRRAIHTRENSQRHDRV
jgi:hypothetical protein